VAKTYTFKVVQACSGGEHIRIRILEDGVAIGVFMLTRTSIMTDDTAPKDLVENLLKRIVKNSSATTYAGYVTDIESASITL